MKFLCIIKYDMKINLSKLERDLYIMGLFVGIVMIVIIVAVIIAAGAAVVAAVAASEDIQED